MQVAYYSRVENEESPRRRVRRLNLQTLIERHGGAAQVARETGKPKSHISAILAGRRGIGDALASKIEKTYVLSPGALDMPGLTGVMKGDQMGDYVSEQGISGDMQADLNNAAMIAAGDIVLRNNWHQDIIAFYAANPGAKSVKEGAATEEYETAGKPKINRRTPVVGTAKMGDGGYYDEMPYPVGHGDGWVDSYSPDPNAYALRVKGDSMHPAIRHGSFVVIEPNSPCVPGEYVVLALRDGRKMVKELVRQNDQEIVIESVNGNHRQTIDLVDIEKMHPVAAVVAASKWRQE